MAEYTPRNNKMKIEFCVGATRWVILIGKYAIKIPRMDSWRQFLYGLLANMQERVFSKTKWPELCPVLFSVPGGWLVIMPRCTSLSVQDFRKFDIKSFTRKETRIIPVEGKIDSFGWFDGRIVAVDYGS